MAWTTEMPGKACFAVSLSYSAPTMVTPTERRSELGPVHYR